MTKLVLSALAFGAVLNGAFEPARWQFRRSIELERAGSIATFTVDSAVYRNSAALADLRIICAGVERPYVLEVLRGSFQEKELQPTVLNKVAVPATGVEVTVDLPVKVMHNRLRVRTPDRNFKQRVRIETSDDGRRWAISRDDGYIFDFSQGDRRVSVLTVDYPVSTSRYVRATIYGWTDPNSLESALLTYSVEHPDTREISAVFNQPAPVPEAKSQSTLYTIDLGFEGLPHDQVELDVEPSLFYRPLEIETSRDKRDWSYAGRGMIYRTPEQQKLTATFPELWDRYLRIRIFNRDDQPLTVRRVTLRTIQRRIKFSTDSTGQYWLYYGNPDAKSPAYDLAYVLPAGSSPARLGPEQRNPDYKPKPPAEKPWSDRHPNILYGVLAASIVAMGYITIRFLLKVRVT